MGVGSKVNRFLQTWFTSGTEDLSPNGEWDVKSLTSGLKKFFANLPEPLLTFKLHSQFINAVKSSEKAKTMKVEVKSGLSIVLFVGLLVIKDVDFLFSLPIYPS